MEGTSPWEDLRGRSASERIPSLKVLPKPAELEEVPRRQRLVSRSKLAEIFRNAEINAAIAEAYREHGYTTKGITD